MGAEPFGCVADVSLAAYVRRVEDVAFCMDATELAISRGACGRAPTTPALPGWMCPEAVRGLTVKLIKEGAEGPHRGQHRRLARL